MAPKVVHQDGVALENGSSYSDVCVIDGHAVSSAKVGFVTTPSVSAPFSNVGDIAITTSGFEGDVIMMYHLRSHVLPRCSLRYFRN